MSSDIDYPARGPLKATRRCGGLEDPRRWVLPALLEDQADRQPDAPWFIGIGGETLTFGTAAHDARRVAGYFAALGVAPGERVVVWAGNHADFVRAWLGLTMLGAVAVLLNTELRGEFLRHQLAHCGAARAVVDASLLPVLTPLVGRLSALSHVVVIGDVPPDPLPIRTIRWSDWRTTKPYGGPLPAAQDTACVMYTSGTSGPSKGVLMPHAHCTLYGIGAVESMQVTDDDRWYIAMPLFHVNGLLMQLGATLLAGIPAVVRQRFSASEWLRDIRQHRATLTNTLGVMAAFIIEQPADASDREHLLRVVNNGPNPAVIEQSLRQRFGVPDVLSGYGMTEVNIPVWGRIGKATPGACGWVSRHFELIVADPDTDEALPPGQVGEILVRPRVPFGFMQGYLGQPDRTVGAWRNLWFHTGDAGILGADGLLTFVDRLKDCIRRRGENISASEVESLVGEIPGVAEVAAYPVPSKVVGGEDELMLAVVPAKGRNLDLHALGSMAESLLPAFARPRYLVAVPELPRTATGKVQRATLRQQGTSGEGIVDRGERQHRGQPVRTRTC